MEYPHLPFQRASSFKPIERALLPPPQFLSSVAGIHFVFSALSPLFPPSSSEVHFLPQLHPHPLPLVYFAPSSLRVFHFLLGVTVDHCLAVFSDMVRQGWDWRGDWTAECGDAGDLPSGKGSSDGTSWNVAIESSVALPFCLGLELMVHSVCLSRQHHAIFLMMLPLYLATAILMIPVV